ncbi:MAG TPA: radical SAM protein [Chthonomonadales bacterium]|nr:radical SAM protein [Chthonomonadales bacterium]
MDGVGYCGLPAGDRTRAAVSWYFGALPTNCVASVACPGGTGAGYPRYALRPGPEHGHKNLAVFYEACSFDCLYCQNWQYRVRKDAEAASPEAVVEAVDRRTTCINFFGGDPAPQIPHALAVAELALAANRGRILRICWETNGTLACELVDRMVESALVSGGVIKFDLKAWDDGVHRALTGASNSTTLANFARVAARVRERPEVPLLVASTTLVPGYVDQREVAGISAFIANLGRGIPYSLLAFHPSCLLDDLPITSWAHMERCVEAAQAAGLTTVHIGNRHMLQPGDYGDWSTAGV